MRTRRWATAAAVGVCLFGMTACGGSDDDEGGGSGGGGELTTVKVAGAPTVARGPLFVGKARGFFEEEGLKVEEVMVESTSAVTAAVTSGDVQFGAGTLDGAILAVSNGVPLKVVAPVLANPAPESETSDDTSITLLVAEDSPIREPKDLEGKTIAVNQLGGLFEVTIRATAARLGIDASTLEFRVLPFAEGVQAMLAGKVDVTASVEPFTTSATGSGGRRILNIFPFDPREQPEWLSGIYYTSEAYLNENRDVVERFARANAKANEYVTKNPDALRGAIPKFTEIDEAVAREMVLPGFPTEIDMAAVEAMADTLLEYDLIKEPVEPDDLVVPVK
jgi:NitT/TauT family transport system substrate-binding protein